MYIHRVCVRAYVHMSIHIHRCGYIQINIHKSMYIHRVRVRAHVCRLLLHLHHRYGVSTMSRLLKIISLFCRIQSLLQDSFAKETYNFEELTNRSHPIANVRLVHICIHGYARHANICVYTCIYVYIIYMNVYIESYIYINAYMYIMHI